MKTYNDNILLIIILFGFILIGYLLKKILNKIFYICSNSNISE